MADVYVVCKNNCLYPGMTKEEIIAAIVEATGNTPTLSDDAFINQIINQNTGEGMKLWVGTTAEYNAIETKDHETYYIITDKDYTQESTMVDAVLLASGWANKYYTLNIEGVTADSNQEILPQRDMTTEQLEALQGANIQDAGQTMGSIILKAYGDVPTIDIPVRVILRGDI